MPKKRTRVACCWKGCSESVHETKLAKHVETHIPKSEYLDTMDYEEHCELLTCQWNVCTFSTRQPRHFRRHVYYHALLARLVMVSENVLLCRRRRPPLPECTRAPSDTNLSPPDLSLPFSCEWEDCTMQFDDPQLFYDHVRYHIICEYSGMSRVQADFKCLWRGCDMLIGKRPTLMLHMQKHTGQRYCVCPRCGALALTRTKFYEHLMRQANDSVRKYKCEYCPKRFATISLRQDHVRSHINTHRCSICGITCNGRVPLQRHIIYRHMDLRPFTCSTCGNSFKSKCNLKRHEKTIHNAEKVPCPHEGCSFVGCSKGSTESHFRNNHGHWSGSWYACHLCSERVRTGTHLSKHLKNEHSLVLPQGHTRFNYKQSPDGLYRLVTLRYESLDVVNQVLTIPPSELQLQEAFTSPSSPSAGGDGTTSAEGGPTSTSPTARGRHQSNSTAPVPITPPSRSTRSSSRPRRRTPTVTTNRRKQTENRRERQHQDADIESPASGVSVMPVVLSLTCAERDPPDSIVTDDGRELALPTSVRNALTSGSRVLVCVQNDQVQLLTRADQVMHEDSADEDNPAALS